MKSPATDTVIARQPILDRQRRHAHASLLELADVVKVDVSLLDSNGLTELVRRLRLRPLRLLAEKVDSAECVRHCRVLGFHLFQGFYFARPVIVGA